MKSRVLSALAGLGQLVEQERSECPWAVRLARVIANDRSKPIDPIAPIVAGWSLLGLCPGVDQLRGRSRIRGRLLRGRLGIGLGDWSGLRLG